ncbi:hypothetical protein GT031_18060 [Streptomyces sp. SID2888]|nr:hypothetical protein [Streptomyces sp. SID2888]
MAMRLSRGSRLSLAVSCAVAVTALLPGARAGALPGDRPSECATGAGHDFPLTARIHGGPGTFQAGGAERTWFIDLGNTTAHACEAVHPVVVLVDSKRVLTAAQVRMRFFDGDRAHPVGLVRSDQAELVGAFDDGFPGFTVAPGRTLTVQVRLALTADARANDVVANAALVQRRGDDGDWVGQSNDYRFRIEGPARHSDTNGSAQPLASRKPAVGEPGGSGQREPYDQGWMLGGLLLLTGGVVATGLPFLLLRRRL